MSDTVNGIGEALAFIAALERTARGFRRDRYPSIRRRVERLEKMAREYESKAKPVKK